MTSAVVKHATCTACGCACDDIELHSDGERITRSDNACALGGAWFRAHPVETDAPAARIGGQPAPLDDAIAEAATILHAAHLPLVYDHGFTTCEAQRQAVALAETVGGVIDSYTSLCHGPSFVATQLVGKVSCTLGEVKNRADFLLYWGCNPAVTHPRHTTRYALHPAGKFTPNGRADRTMVLVDVRETETATDADLFLRIREGKDFEALTALTALLKGQPVNADRVAETGLTVEQLGALLERMKAARFGALFFGLGLSAAPGGYANPAAAYRLVMELNGFTKFVALPMRQHGNLVGSDMVLRWTTGYPFGVSLSRGYPRYNPGEFTAAELLARGDIDAALLVGGGVAEALPRPAADALARVPTVELAPKLTPSGPVPRVQIRTAATGISAGGTVCRMDDIPIPLRPSLASPYPTDEDVLKRILAAVRKLPPWYPTPTTGPQIA
jgi:formylmethanofuran dehydrogenase subunit B